jgi:hypothetical protein
MRFLVFCLIAAGTFLVGVSITPNVYRKAKTALKNRADKRLTASEIMINSMAKKFIRFINIDPIKRQRLEDDLHGIGYDITPEMFKARALATAIIYSAALLFLIPLSPVLGVLIIAFTMYTVYTKQEKTVKAEIEKRKEVIERELPQFAGTISQNLKTTRDVIGILERYRRVCGPALLGEIDRTLNDIKTGNAERAIIAFESRVSSAKLSQLTKGLIGVLRGDNQQDYFARITEEYRKAQNEAVKRELIKRPEKLKPNVILLLVCMMAMFIVAIGMYLASSAGTIF